jgi:signal transduction histidine kinase/tetratricopeptide (TPR) repeat protein
MQPQKIPMMILLICGTLLIVLLGTNQQTYAQQWNTDSLAAELKWAKHDTSQTDLMLKISYSLIYNQTIEAEKWARKALTKAEKLQNAKRRAQALNLLGIGKDLVNQIDSAYYYYNLALNQARIAKNKLVLASSLNNLGMLQQKQGYYKEATPYFHEAASLFHEIKYEQMEANVLNNLGLVYYELEQWDKATEYHTAALKIRRRINDLPGIAASLNNLAIIADDKKQYNEAIALLKEAEMIRKKLNDNYGLGIVYTNLAEVYYSLKDYKRVIFYSKKALKARTLSGDNSDKTRNYHQLFTVYLTLNDIVKAKQYLDSSEKLIENQKSLTRLVKLLEAKIEYQKYLKNYKQISAYYAELISLKDSLFKTTLAEKLAENEAKFKLKQSLNLIDELSQENRLMALKAENESNKRKNQLLYSLLIVGALISVFGAIFAHWRYKINVLRKEEEARFQQKIFLETLNAEDKERQRIAMELHDGLGQLLSAALLNIRAISGGGGQEYNHASIENAEKAIKMCIDEMRHTAHNLMPSTLVRKGLIRAIEETIHTINSSEKLKVSLHFNEVPENLSLQVKHTIFRVVQETINNIIKHGNATQIDIGLHSQQDKFIVEIRDNGKNYELKPNTETGGIGLRSIITRITFLKGKLNFSKKGENENVFSLELNLKEV